MERVARGLPAGPAGWSASTGLGGQRCWRLTTNLLEPTVGAVRVSGAAPESAAADRRTTFLNQGKPHFRRFTVEETLRLGRELTPGWDQRAAEEFVRAGNVLFNAKVGALSGGSVPGSPSRSPSASARACSCWTNLYSPAFGPTKASSPSSVVMPPSKGAPAHGS
ncbi:hypothetical protein [Streptomyces silvisoli]|uniref:hypothetical protein n=1 Tax=Streptomyces silvisoli TaxID=3034235 RepID=UPI0028BE13F4|nr:hypothetical protein [Streptomyces silvisoli]